MNQKIRTSVFSVVSLKIPQMGESPKTTAVTDGAASEAPETVVRLNQYLFTEVAQLRQTYPLPALDIYVNSTLELSGPST